MCIVLNHPHESLLTHLERRIYIYKSNIYIYTYVSMQILTYMYIYIYVFVDRNISFKHIYISIAEYVNINMF